MKQQIKCVAPAAILSLWITACGGSDGGDVVVSQESLLANLQGSWTTECQPDGPSSSQTRIAVTGTEITQSFITYIGSVECGEASEFSRSVSGLVLSTGDVVPLLGGPAISIDVNYITATVSYADTLPFILSAIGTNVDQLLESVGIADANAVQVTEIVDTAELFTLYRADAKTLLLGLTDTGNTGASAELRPAELDINTIFIRDEAPQPDAN